MSYFDSDEEAPTEEPQKAEPSSDDLQAAAAKLKAGSFQITCGGSAGGTVGESPMQQVAEKVETGLNVVVPNATGVTDALKNVEDAPGVGEILGGLQGVYHMSAAAYDGMHGDRDGAISQGVQGAMGLASMIPGVAPVLGAADGIIGGLGGAAKLIGGEDAKDAPQSAADMVAGMAVSATNAVFGKDDSNWFAPGDKPTGNRRGEIGAGTNGVAGTLASEIPYVGPLLAQPFSSGALDQPVGDAVGGAFDTPKDAPTTGAGEPNNYQKSGQEAHDMWTGLF